MDNTDEQDGPDSIGAWYTAEGISRDTGIAETSLYRGSDVITIKHVVVATIGTTSARSVLTSSVSHRYLQSHQPFVWTEVLALGATGETFPIIGTPTVY